MPTLRSRAQDPSSAAIELSRASVRIGSHTIWSEVTLRMARGEFLALLGPNGAGKSTLLKVLLGLLGLDSGRVSVLGGAPARARRDIGYLPQRRSFDATTRLRGLDIVRLGLDGTRYGLPLALGRAPAGSRRHAERQRIAEVIDLVGASAYAHRPIGELSGGEQQRLLIAQALVQSPDLLLLDEPLDSLDLPNQALIAALVADICHQASVAVLLVAHDVNPLLAHLDGVIYLAGGRSLQGTVEQVVTGETLSRLYGVPVEVLRASDGRLVVIGGPEASSHHHDRHDHTHPG
ncbi:MAG TPA: ATP-binding cassette domain-containing protein [Solirubrobacteraceae bacterium]|jgi:zinc/manganese transport system ATP-binding protein